MIAMETAVAQIAAVVANRGVMAGELVPLSLAGNRILAESLKALVSVPPFAVAAMDGWALNSAAWLGKSPHSPTLAPTQSPVQPLRFKLAGEVAAGGWMEQPLAPDSAVRIFTGAALPPAADAIVIQENAKIVTVNGESLVEISEPVAVGRHIRQAGVDFVAGQELLRAGGKLSSRDLALAAAANYSQILVRKKPRVGILATGNELVAPGFVVPVTGAKPSPRIVSSNSIAVAELVREFGGEAIDLGIARDDEASIVAAVQSVSGLDILVTIGGASVGDYDLVQPSLAKLGLAVEFWKIAMRPGKPLIFGKFEKLPLDGVIFLGLPGNPVSSFICSLMFLRPIILQLLGAERRELVRVQARLEVPMLENDQRREFLRASLRQESDGGWWVTPATRQDSSLQSVLAAANALIDREPFAAAAVRGDLVSAIVLG